LAAHQPEQAQSQVTQAIERWSPQGFHIQHWWGMIAQVEVALYAGEVLKAWELLARLWPRASPLAPAAYSIHSH
jgi:hypothetical protein